MDADTDILSYWKANRSIYPNLANLARRYLSTPPGSAAPERMFSLAKHVLKDTRLSMKPQNLEMNLFLKRALQSFDYETDFPSPPANFEPPNRSSVPDAEMAHALLGDSDNSDIEISSDEDDS